MGPLVVDLVTAILMLAVAYGSPRTMLGVLIGTLLLIPEPLVAPHLHTSYATVDDLVIAAAAVRLVSMYRRGEIGRDQLRATPTHLALALLLVTWAVVGVVFAPLSGVPSAAVLRMVNLTFVALFFVVVLTLLRVIDRSDDAVRMLTRAFGVAVVIAVLEHFSGRAYGHFLFNLAGHPGPTVAAHVLESRDGHVRVRSSGEFALAFAWVAVMMLPFVAARAVRTARRYWVWLPVLALTLLAIYWTYARSAAAAVPVVLVLAALFTRDRRMVWLAGAAVVVSVALFAFDPTIRSHVNLSLSSTSGSTAVRFQRLPPILAAVAPHPYLGLGLGGLQTIGFLTTDNFYLNAYGETGVIGAAILLAVCLLLLLQVGRGLLVADPRRRMVTGAAAVGVIAFFASGAIDDALLIQQQAMMLVLLVAVSIAATEPERGPALMPRWSTRRTAFLTAAGALAGLAAYLLAPVTVSQERQFGTVSALRNIYPYDAITSGQLLIGTVCSLASAIDPTMPDVHINCIDDYGPAGVGTLRIESPSTRQTLAAYDTLANTVHHAASLAAYQTFTSGPPISSRATIWKTAPASGAVLGFAIAMLAPLPLRRRVRARRLPRHL
ncbi:MAG TPA: O-antigen ligase family protein [Mycobacteriales bacterium]|nr:O-antigen ligase family protein [Mycobacteriales bacterium]